MSEKFREAHSPDADYTQLDHALAAAPPDPGSCPVEQMRWVAATIDELNLGHESAKLYTGFGTVYGPLSHSIAKGVEKGEFDEPEALARQAIGFLDRWRMPVAGIARYLRGEDKALETVLQSWQMTYMDSRMENAKPVTHFTAGMISHIMGDLALSLAKSQPPLSYYDDYTTKVGGKIADITKQLAPELMPGHPLLRKAVIPVVVGGIAQMRKQAWKDFCILNEMPDEAKKDKGQVFDRRAIVLNDLLLRVDGPAMWAASMTERFPTPPWLTDDHKAA